MSLTSLRESPLPMLRSHAASTRQPKSVPRDQSTGSNAHDFEASERERLVVNQDFQGVFFVVVNSIGVCTALPKLP